MVASADFLYSAPLSCGTPTTKQATQDNPPICAQGNRGLLKSSTVLLSTAPTYSSGLKADGKKKKGKAARCLFCGFVHPLETVKAKGEAGQYEDTLIVVADTDQDR